MVYRKTLDGPWVCSWNCGFMSQDVRKVIAHETTEHLKIENYSREAMDTKEKYYLKRAEQNGCK